MALLAYLAVLWYERPPWLKSHWRRLLFLGSIAAFAGCFACSPYGREVLSPPVQNTSAFDTAEVGMLMPFQPLWFYDRWWQNVERCSGYRGDIRRIRFYLANKPFLRTPQLPGLFLGIYFREASQEGDGRGRILLGITELMDSVVVHHEFLHALRDQNGQADAGGSQHGEVDFVERCGAVIGPLPRGSH